MLSDFRMITCLCIGHSSKQGKLEGFSQTIQNRGQGVSAGVLPLHQWNYRTCLRLHKLCIQVCDTMIIHHHLIENQILYIFLYSLLGNELNSISIKFIYFVQKMCWRNCWLVLKETIKWTYIYWWKAAFSIKITHSQIVSLCVHRVFFYSRFMFPIFYHLSKLYCTFDDTILSNYSLVQPSHSKVQDL